MLYSFVLIHGHDLLPGHPHKTSILYISGLSYCTVCSLLHFLLARDHPCGFMSTLALLVSCIVGDREGETASFVLKPAE